LLSGEISLNLATEQFRPMIRTILPTNFLEVTARFPVIDVRSPGEFGQGHVPGAVNIPLFDDSERAIIGTLYVKSGHDEAIMKGLDIALPKIEFFLESLNPVCSKGMILLHCWRGGMRSALMAEVFSKAGYEVDVLSGGYKAYRHAIREGFSMPARVVVLGGYTGTGKTEILNAMAMAGEQVIDLEQLASHKGSVFGALGQPDQPTNEQFENDLWFQWQKLDLSRPVWLEDESRMIGRITLPDPVVEQLSNGLLIRAELDVTVRIERLVKEYADFDNMLLAGAINKISERLGGAMTKAALAALDNGRFADVAAIVLAYYDKAYLFSVTRRKNQNVRDIRISGRDPAKDAAQIIEFSRKYL
jgi:tRNA 2-selenouridine synthase